MTKEYPRCECGNPSNTASTSMNDFGCWDVCEDCGKQIDGTFEYFNHYDGEDHMFEWSYGN